MTIYQSCVIIGLILFRYDQVLYAKVNLILANLCISGKNLCDSPPDYKRAKNYFKIFKNIHEENFIDKITIFGYERMMQCYFNIGNFDCAIKWCKRMLVLALISNDFLCEVKIYDMLCKYLLL